MRSWSELSPKDDLHTLHRIVHDKSCFPENSET